jgi:hypothetical protein
VTTSQTAIDNIGITTSDITTPTYTNITTISELISKSNDQCPNGPGFYATSDCLGYYECKNDTSSIDHQITWCSDNKLFDVKRNKCFVASHVECASNEKTSTISSGFISSTFKSTATPTTTTNSSSSLSPTNNITNSSEVNSKDLATSTNVFFTKFFKNTDSSTNGTSSSLTTTTTNAIPLATTSSRMNSSTSTSTSTATSCLPGYTGLNCEILLNGIYPKENIETYKNALENLNNVSSLKSIIEMLKLNTDITQCLLNCSNNGKCAYINETNNFVCLCFQNYTGSLCNIDKRPCNLAKLQCINNGICINNRINNNNDDYNFTCNCSYPFYGDRCQFKINICKNITCSNKGICKIVNNTIPMCKCFNGYSGDNCEISNTKIMIIKAVSFTSVGISIAFFVCFISLIIYIDISRYLRFKSKNVIHKIDQNKSTRLEAIQEE